MRVNIIHHGLLIQTQSFHEICRYIHYLIYDLVLGMLGVASQRAIVAREAAGLDLRAIGLQNYGPSSDGAPDPTVIYG
jgi:hypothetical protein